jgi:hypothetical protein
MDDGHLRGRRRKFIMDSFDLAFYHPPDARSNLMKNRSRIISTLLLFVLAVAFLPLQTVYAKGIVEEGKIIFGDNFTLKEGEELDGDLVVLGGNVTIEEGAKVTGTVVVFGGNVDSDGAITKDLVSFGGNIDLAENAKVSGDVVIFGGNINADPKAVIKGEIVKNTESPSISIPNVDAPVNPTEPFVVDYGSNPLVNAAGVLARSLAMAALAMLIAVFLQPQIDKVSSMVRTQPMMAGGFGLLTVLLAPLAIVLLVVTILLIPVAAIGVFILILAWLFGMIAMGQEVGDRFTKAINKTWAPVLTTGFGTFLLVFVSGFIGIIPCVGGLTNTLLGLLAIGASIMTWFNSRQRTTPPPAASNTELAAGS